MVLEINSNRELFTRHGLHLNGLGKQRISKQIAAQISTILVEKAEGPGDPTPLLENRNEIHTRKKKLTNEVSTLDSKKTSPTTANRQKKVPVTRKNDFLW